MNLKPFVVSFCVLFSSVAFSANLHYSLVKKEGKNSGSTLLVIGGIHGDEPGGYFAPLLLTKYYTIESGNVWIVPNLNFDSIANNVRGIYGDMNRKFAKIDAKDKDFQIVADIKKLILTPKVDLTLNLHDGQGFYREKNINKTFNPKAWGQATIIDQQQIPNAKYGNLGEIAKKVNKETNIDLLEDVHEFNVKDTNTKKQDKAMQQSLTYFSITNNKPAFAIETSKNITNLSQKVFYQLKTIEEFMNLMNIKFSRSFELTQKNVDTLLDDYGMLEIPTSKITLNLSTLKSSIAYFPMNKDTLVYSSDNPLISVIQDKDTYKIMNGNIFISRLKPEYSEFDNSLEDVKVVIDGKKTSVKVGALISVKHDFTAEDIKGYRVNLIGYSKSGLSNESGVKVTHKDFIQTYAIDKNEQTFMVQFYKDKKFCGMVNIKFDNEKK